GGLLAGRVLQALLRIITHSACGFAPALRDNYLGTALSPGREPLHLVNLAIDLPLGPGGMFINHSPNILITLPASEDATFGLQSSPCLTHIVSHEVLNPHWLGSNIRRSRPGGGDLVNHVVVRLRRHEPTLPRGHIVLPHNPEDLSTVGGGIALP